MADTPWVSVSFDKLIGQFNKIQCQTLRQLSKLASNISTATPGKFLLIQFAML